MMNTMKEGDLRPEPMPEALLAELFKSGVVVFPEEFAAPSAPPAAPAATAVTPSPRPDAPVAELQWLGNFGRRVLVVVQDPMAKHLNDEDFELLGKILGAVGLSMADIALVNAASMPLEYNALQEKLPAAVAIYFGLQPVDIGAPIKFPMFQVQQWNNCSFLYAPGLDEMGPVSPNATSLKKELWAALKKIFA